MKTQARFRPLALMAALLAFVAASTVAIVTPELIVGAAATQSPTLNQVLVVGHP
ncbi:hypothetical protein [Massilia sp. TWR1-2-2]|uniref:hypothetical protein n=1 Tax=Massilia sp. TWR1-2-2 TaxID=2804584 RepID=UPI003CF50D82